MKREMIFKLFMFILTVVIIQSARERDIKSLSDEEYETSLMLEKHSQC